MSPGGTTLEVRPAEARDRPAMLALARRALGWADDERHEALFRWKHWENPFGPSLAVVGCVGDRLVGLRMLMRWEFEATDGPVRAARAVDTATDPEHRGRGIFTTLTRRGLEDLADDGTAFVFNTPNDQSRPGYLKMGWRIVGRLPVAARPTSAGGLTRMVRARTAARHWSAPTTAGEPAVEVLADRPALARLLARPADASSPATTGLRTRRTPEHLAWRYGSRPIEYRAVVGRDGIESGLALFRIRERGPAREAIVADVLVPGDEPDARRALLRRVVRAVDADYVLALEHRVLSPGGFVRIPGQGPLLTARAVAAEPPARPEGWTLALGDVELF